MHICLYLGAISSSGRALDCGSKGTEFKTLIAPCGSPVLAKGKDCESLLCGFDFRLPPYFKGVYMDDNFYKALILFMKKNGKKIKDIEFIQSYDYEGDWDDDYQYDFKVAPGIIFFEIPIVDFIREAKKIDCIDSSDTLKIVGKDWWIVTDTDGNGYFEFYQMPERPKKIKNLAKELLLHPDSKAEYILNIKFDEDEDV